MGMVVNGGHEQPAKEEGHGGTEQNGKAPDQDHIKMFVGQIPRNFSEDDVRQIFEEFGDIYAINILKDKLTGAGKGCCFVTFYKRKSALDAQNALHNIRTLPGMHNPIQMKPADTENRTERKLFCGMISRSATEDDIRRMFAPYGPIEECTILRDSSGSSRGCCFVTLSSRSSALNAIRVLHHSMTSEGCTSPLVVKMADTTKDKDSKRQALPMGSAALGLAGLGQLGQLGFGNLLQSTGTFNLATLLAAQQAGLAGFNLSGLSQLASSGLNSGLLNISGGNAHNGGLSNGASSLSNFTTTNSGNGLYGSNSNLGTLSFHEALQSQQQQQMVQRLLEGSSGQNAMASAFYGSPLSSLSNNSYSGAMPSSPYDSRNLAQLSLLQALSTSGNSVSPVNKQSEGPEGCNLFIYHLPAEYTDSELIQLFASFGNLISAKVFIDKQTGLSKCFGFVSYSQPASAQQAISAMNGFQIGMKRLKVQLKRNRESSRPY
ncbi:hypothetical protein RvY_09175 [Ramazzottius varieornatus]|uniref:Protein alan shepard n=1 Tax=Ramazzottius varieornatus TaxID=947166 RepID=A0A1D1V8D7_RAMVA|nr:hypothetical protein RvY_09175 [Ramazzottius varieornatus]